MITEQEYNQRLDAHEGYLRKKMAILGHAALWKVITSKGSQKKVVKDASDTSNALRFLLDCWVDKDGDVISKDSKKHFYASRGISVDDERRII